MINSIIKKMTESELNINDYFDRNRGITDTFFTEIATSLLKGYVLYLYEAKKWLTWDGRRWVIDQPCSIFPHISEIIKKLYSETSKLNDEQRVKFAPELIKLESHSRQVNLIKALSVIPDLVVTSNYLDQDIMLLNCLNGTIDLSTGSLLLHSPAHNITKIINCQYTTNAPCPKFLNFLETIFGSNAELIEYIKRFFGYCLTGRNDEQVFVFFYGNGGNGKSTLINTFIELLNDFAISSQADLIMQKSNRSNSNDMARLKGARIVAVNEVEEGASIAEAQIKSLTGGDVISARYLFKEFIEFVPQCKFILVGNHRPNIKGSDEGIWRRIHLIPFNITIPAEKKNPDLMREIRAEFPGILAWAVQGCLEWQEKSLKPPSEVLLATKAYRHDEDKFSQWVEDCCKLEIGAEDTAENLLDSFIAYSGWDDMTQHKLTRKLNGIGVNQQKKGKGVRVWHGISVDCSTMN